MDFFKEVYRLVRRIPRGKVATYGQIAGFISTPRAARLVGFALRRSPNDVPWQRVINSKGMISIENLHCPKELQAKLLESENVKVVKRNGNYFVSLKKYLWKFQ
ncbi:MAG: MGMT family protein [Patescibacteria group bacterium]|nr:MGMT family protein [Patescibacteria group bacterium]